jgi:hypothetical protein
MTFKTKELYQLIRGASIYNVSPVKWFFSTQPALSDRYQDREIFYVISCAEPAPADSFYLITVWMLSTGEILVVRGERNAHHRMWCRQI